MGIKKIILTIAILADAALAQTTPNPALSIPAHGTAVDTREIPINQNSNKLDNYRVVTAFGLVCNGTTDDTAALTSLLASIGAATTTLLFPSGQTLLNHITIPANVSLDFSRGGAIKVASGQTVTILGSISKTMRQIFYNALAGQGSIDFTGNYALEAVYPEWWGASPSATAATNTPALQAAIYGAFGNNRTNTSRFAKYNREFHLSGRYDINDELRTYHMIGFLWTGQGRLSSGINQTATNRRIIDGQSVAYGTFQDISFSTSASQTVPLIDLDYDGTQGADLAVQNITFQDVVWEGNGLGQIGPLIAKTSGAQGDNIRFYNNYLAGFTQSCAQIGGNNTGLNAGRFYAQNALQILFEGGDIQACPQYGIASYGGSVIVKDMTFEDDVTNTGAQTGFDVYCEAPQTACVMENVRSESIRLMAGGNIRISNSNTQWKPQQWYNPNGPQSLAGTVGTVNELISGTGPGGDGRYYKVTVGGTFGGLGITSATSGSGTTIVNSGASWTTSAFVGYQATIYGGTGQGQTCVITANTGTTITCSAGWKTNYVLARVVDPDATSTFVVEPNWGTQTTSGTVTFALLEFNTIEGNYATTGSAVLRDVSVPGGRVLSLGDFKNLVVSRSDWMQANLHPLEFDAIPNRYDNIIVVRPGSSILGHHLLKWSFPRNGLTGYSNWSQMQMGAEPIVWSVGKNGGEAANDIWIGGRSDPESGRSASRTVLEYGGILGRATPFGTDENGTDTDIQGGLATGAGTPGSIEFWLGSSGSMGSTITGGAPVWKITPPGNLVATLGRGQHINTKAAGNDFDGTCTASLATTCTVTFTTAYTSAPACVATDQTNIVAVKVTPSTTSLVITTSDRSSDVFAYHCAGNPN
jgi:hypothetical protein